MAFVEQAHVNDIGTVFRVTIYDTTATGGSEVADISTATTKNFIFQRPDGTSFTKVATFTTDGSDGKIEYATVDGDLGKAGTWSIQAYVATSGGTWNSSVANFRVFENLS
tara:strand:+ start:5763 stop:6092 length:330 start_codon:yes stop_codon:yes gene_type:complete